MSRANLNKDPDEVAAMFDGVAKRYDLVNDLLSLGRTKAWRKAATRIIDPKPGMVILDLAAGPGSSSEPLFKAGASVFATDFSEGMLAQGRKARPYLNFSKADALNLYCQPSPKRPPQIQMLMSIWLNPFAHGQIKLA